MRPTLLLRTSFLLWLLLGVDVPAIPTEVDTPAEDEAPATAGVPVEEPAHIKIKIAAEAEDLMPATTEAEVPAVPTEDAAACRGPCWKLGLWSSCHTTRDSH